MEQNKSQCKKDGVTYSLISAPQALESVQHPCSLFSSLLAAQQTGREKTLPQPGLSPALTSLSPEKPGRPFFSYRSDCFPRVAFKGTEDD